MFEFEVANKDITLDDLNELLKRMLVRIAQLEANVADHEQQIWRLTEGSGEENGDVQQAQLSTYAPLTRDVRDL